MGSKFKNIEKIQPPKIALLSLYLYYWARYGRFSDFEILQHGDESTGGLTKNMPKQGVDGDQKYCKKLCLRESINPKLPTYCNNIPGCTPQVKIYIYTFIAL